MKTLFIEGRYKEKIEFDNKAIDCLPNKILLATTIQYYDSIDCIKTQLEKRGKIVKLYGAKHAKYPGQVLGCSIEKCNDDFDAFLYIGDGMFHPLVFSIKNQDKQAFRYNPFTKELKKVEKEYAAGFERAVKDNLNKYSKAKNIGIIVTTKPGQERLKDATVFKLKAKEKGKNPYLFVCETLDFLQLLNFPFIECWVNTMCPRIVYDDAFNIERPIVNLDDVY